MMGGERADGARSDAAAAAKFVGGAAAFVRGFCSGMSLRRRGEVARSLSKSPQVSRARLLSPRAGACRRGGGGAALIQRVLTPPPHHHLTTSLVIGEVRWPFLSQSRMCAASYLWPSHTRCVNKHAPARRRQRTFIARMYTKTLRGGGCHIVLAHGRGHVGSSNTIRLT